MCLFFALKYFFVILVTSFTRLSLAKGSPFPNFHLVPVNSSFDLGVFFFLRKNAG